MKSSKYCWTAALLLILGALTAGVVALTGLNTTLNPERANDSLRQTLHALRYESAHQAMPEGDFAAGVDFSDTPMLKVTLSRPEALYLRGFIGQRYTRQGWEDLSAESLSQQAGDVYWLQSNDFFAQTQLSRLASLLNLDTPAIDVQVDVSGAMPSCPMSCPAVSGALPPSCGIPCPAAGGTTPIPPQAT